MESREEGDVPRPITGSQTWHRRAGMLEVREGERGLPKPAGKTRVWYAAAVPSLTAQKVYYLLLRHAYERWSGQPGRPHSITFTEIAAFLNQGKSSRVGHVRIREALEEIAGTQLKYEFFEMAGEGRRRWEGCTVLMTFAASEDADRVVFHLPRDVELFLMDPEYYCYVEPGMVRNATTIYTMPCYELIAPLVVSRDAGEAVYDATALAKLIGHPVPLCGKVEPARFKRTVVDRVVADVNAHSATISVEASQSKSKIKIRATKRGARIEDGLARPPGLPPPRRPGKGVIPSRPPSAVLKAWKETYPEMELGYWWADFRAACGSDPHYGKHLTARFMERVRTILTEQDRLALRARRSDWKTIDEGVLRLAVRQFQGGLPKWTGCGQPPKTVTERLLRFWHGFLRYADHHAEGDPYIQAFLHGAVDDPGKALLMALEHDRLAKWKMLTELEGGMHAGIVGDI